MPKTILLADDSVTIQKVVAISFASEDVSVVTVDNGDDAITKAREIRPDIVLADVVMPGKSGYEVCEAIKADPELSQIPVLLLTGTFEAFDEARASEVGSAGHIAKPFEAQSLIDEVRRLIDTAASATPTPQAAPAESAESPAANADAFDFFDEEAGAQDLSPAQNSLEDVADLEFKSPASDFTYGDDDLNMPASPPEQSVPVTTEVAPPAESVDVTGASPVADAIPLVAELETPLLAQTSVVFDGDSPDDSLAPDASRSGDQPFDFAIAEEVTDPLADLEPVPPMDASDLAQATVIDPLGASGYDVSSSDLGPPMSDAPPSSPQVATNRADEAEMTMLAPEPEANTGPDTDPIASEPIANDLTSVVGEDPVYADFTTPPQVEPSAADEEASPVLAAELYAEPAPVKTADTPATNTAEPAEAMMAAIGPELRQQLHDTLEKIAWESFGDLTEAIVRQAVERVETIAWEVIPRMAEVLIQEEIRIPTPHPIPLNLSAGFGYPGSSPAPDPPGVRRHAARAAPPHSDRVEGVRMGFPPALPPERTWFPLVDLALNEDIGAGDATTPLVVEVGRQGAAIIEARQPLVVCGLEIAFAVFRAIDSQIQLRANLRDGEQAEPGDVLATVRGDLRGILAAERTALNFLMRMCGVASWTRRFVDAVAGTGVRIVDTRKTLPGWRSLDKYATEVGGATNHRVGLYDGILLKDNHVAIAGGVGLAVKAALAAAPANLRVSVEVESEAQAVEAVESGADYLLLDNRTLPEMQAIAALLAQRAQLEVTGGVQLGNVREIAETGVHRISIGALTHSAPAADVALEIENLAAEPGRVPA